MATVTTRPTNGVSFGYLHTVTSTDQSDGFVIIDFQVDYNMVASIMVTDGSPSDPNQTSPIVSLGDAEVSYPAEGQIRIASGDSTFSLTAGYVLHVLAQRRSS